jgi:hypothetical protein
MLKRNIAILIAGGLLSVQAGLAGAQSAIPPSADEAPYVLLPAQVKYFAEREAANPNPIGATGRVFPASGTGGTSSLPALAKYLDERATQIANDKTVVRVAFSPNCMASADDTHVWRTN